MASQYITDLNCDMGESYGTWILGNDEAIMPYISSVNIACGFHAGDPTTMKKTVKLALEHGVAIGAHPGLPDLQGFGRREMNITAEEAYDMVVYQIGALAAIVRAEGGELHHVKPHGALYNMAAVKTALADAIALAVQRVDEQLVLYGLSGSELIRSGQKHGLKVFSEVFADRTYQQDGTLTPRNLPGALITDHQESLKQVLKMVTEGKVSTQQGSEVDIKADTICIHGDGATALEFAEKIYNRFKEEGIRIK